MSQTPDAPAPPPTASEVPGPDVSGGPGGPGGPPGAGGQVGARAKDGRRRRAVRATATAAAVVLLVGAAASSAWLLGGRRAAPPAASPSAPRVSSTAAASPSDGDSQQVGALTRLLDDRSAAVLHHDRSAWLAAIDPRAPRFRARQAAVFDHFQSVPFASWSYQYAGRAPDLSPERVHALGARQAWVARVLAGYRLRGFDSTTATTEQYLTMVLRGGRWYIATDTDGGTAPQPWDLGDVRVARGDHVLVLGTAPAATVRSYARAGDDAVARVSEVWGARWSQRAVLLAPRTQDEFGRLLLRAGDGLSQVAAVTTGELGSLAVTSRSAGQTSRGEETGRAGNDRVVINPGAFARLGDTGRRVVLTHELTHVAIRQTTTASVPIWLSEGFADFVGYRGTGVSRQVGAGDLLASVRQGHVPTSLPTADDFDPTRTTIAPAYAASWLACLVISDTYGTSKLVALYRAAATAPADGSEPDPDAQLKAAFPRVLHTSEAAFTKHWRRYVIELAG